MRITDTIEIIDTALLIDKSVLVIADPHIGYDEYLNKKGVLVPRTHFKETIQRLEKILSRTKGLKKIVINGDLKHEFGRISETEWRNTLKLLDFLSKHAPELVLLKGNHDTILGPIAQKRNLMVTHAEKIKDILIVHGDAIPDNDLLRGIKTVIIGHEHPAITVRDTARVEKYKCFLKGTWKRKTLIVQPSFNPLVEGTDMVSESKLSPLLKGNLKEFEVFIVSDDVYYFGKLNDL